MPTKKEKQPLSITHPELAKEADGWDPANYSGPNSIKRNWRCKKNHLFSAAIKDRTNGKTGCPYCAGTKLLTGFNDFKTLLPDLAAEAFGWEPSTIRKSDSTVREWKCNAGHIWSGKVVERANGKATCPYCRGRKAIPGETDLATTHPQVAAEADGWDPTQIRYGSGEVRNWRCKVGHTWSAIVSSRATGKQCPFCSGRYSIEGENDLETLFPKIAAEADGWDPKKIHPGTQKVYSWRCNLGHTWRATPAQRTRKSSMCPTCGNDKVLAGFNDLLTTHPKIAAEAFNWDPSTVVAGSHKIREWKCEKGHLYKTPIHQRALSGGGCGVCSGQKTLVGFNDIASLSPDLASEADGWNPQEFVSSSHRIVGWKCALGHKWSARIFSRVKNNLGCPVCAGKQLLVGFNDLHTTHPEIANQADGWDPETVTKGHSLKKKWICSEGHRWSARPSTRTAGFGCPTCAQSGFDPNKDGWLYFIEHFEWDMFQIGITNFPNDRLHSHQKLGWNVTEIRGPMNGHLTQNWETSILRMLKAKGADLANSKIAGKFDGYSEAWSKSTFEAKSIKELMRLTEEFEENSLQKKNKARRLDK